MTPRDVLRLAARLNLSVPGLFVAHLGFDRWFGELDGIPGTRERDTWVVLPAARTGYGPGQCYARSLFEALSGRRAPMPCRLLTADGLCSIHDTKPRECRSVYGYGCEYDRAYPEGTGWRYRIARAWARPPGVALMTAIHRALAEQGRAVVNPDTGDVERGYLP